MSTINIGVDLAKSVFSVCEVDAAGRVLGRRDLGREAFVLWLAQRPPGMMISESLKARGKGIKWAVLTGSLLRNC